MKASCNACNIYRKFKNTKISYIFEKRLDLSIAYSRYSHEYKKIFKEEESVGILKVLGLITKLLT